MDEQTFNFIALWVSSGIILTAIGYYIGARMEGGSIPWRTVIKGHISAPLFGPLVIVIFAVVFISIYLENRKEA